MSTSTPPSVPQEFVAALNRHGFAFQHAVISRGAELSDARRTRWLFEASEFPVSVGTAVTHIDLVFRSRERDVYLVGECKRVDPALGRWAFARAPYTRRNVTRDEVIFEQLRPHNTSKLSSEPFKFPWSRDPYHIGIELKTSATGDGTGSGRNTIEQAVTQVLRGTNGLANHFFALDWASVSGRIFRFIPVVFTTADIWTTEADLKTADLATGRLEISSFSAEPAGWVWLNYNQSPQLRHSLTSDTLPTSLAAALVAGATRSVAMVSPTGLDDFLTKDLADG